MLQTLLELLAIGLLGVGLTLATIGLYGLLRMPDMYAQLHANGLVTGPATIAILLAAIGTGETEVITSAILVVLFVLVTTPLASHAIARTTHEREGRAAEHGER